MPRALVTSLGVVIACLLAGCGGERTFDAGEFVDEVNDEGAQLTLGESLSSSRDDVDLYVVSFADPGSATGGEGHTGGTLAIAADVDAAIAEFARCEGSVTLACYRAANAVLYFEGEPTDPDIARVDAAVRALASD